MRPLFAIVFPVRAIVAQSVEHHFRKVGVASSILANGSMKPPSAQAVWDDEYTRPVFTSFNREPHQVVKDFLKHLRRKELFELEGKVFFDAGCGIGKDVQYATDHYGMRGIGCDLSSVAIAEAERYVPGGNFFVQDLETVLPLGDASVDVAVLVMVIHALSEKGRHTAIAELARVIKQGGFLFLKTVAVEGDSHAKHLIKTAPGNEPSSFIHPELQIPEYVYSRETLLADLGSYFDVILLEKTAGYQKWNNQSYKRNYWIAYLKRK